MSLLMWEQAGDRIAIFTDTAVAVSRTREVGGFHAKLDTVPHLNLAICATGDVATISLWRHWINMHPAIDSLAELAELAPPVLRDIWQHTTEFYDGHVPAACRTHIYHLGIDDAGRAVSYAFAVDADFEPETNYAARQWHTPSLDGAFVPFSTREKAIELACRIKADEEQRGFRGEEYVLIGGELYMTVLTDGQITHTRVHVFDDWAGPSVGPVPYELRVEDGHLTAEKAS